MYKQRYTISLEEYLSSLRVCLTKLRTKSYNKYQTIKAPFITNPALKLDTRLFDE